MNRTLRFYVKNNAIVYELYDKDGKLIIKTNDVNDLTKYYESDIITLSNQIELW